jgi:hypothetical protein
VDAVFWTRTSEASNRRASESEKEHAKKVEGRDKEMSEEELETFNKVKALVRMAEYGRADMPEGTIITAPYFSDIIVPVTTQARLDEGAARANQ